nr:unnamed protein product [Callosobruchus analis]
METNTTTEKVTIA